MDLPTDFAFRARHWRRMDANRRPTRFGQRPGLWLLLFAVLLVADRPLTIEAAEGGVEKAIKGVTITPELERRNTFNYRTTGYELTVEPLTSFGLFTLAWGRESGKTMTVGPLILPSVDLDHLLVGTTTLRKPTQPWQADKYRISYGLALPLAGGELQGGIGLGGYHGDTAAASGLDSKKIEIFEYGGKMNWSRGRAGVNIALRSRNLDLDTGSRNYNTIIDRRELEGLMGLTLPLTTTWGIEGEITRRAHEQLLEFDPMVFPSHQQKARRHTWRLGLNHGGISGWQRISAGGIINRGAETGSVIARPLGRIGDNLGFYLQAESDGGTEYQLSFERLNGSGTEDYLTTSRDLTEKLRQSEIALQIANGRRSLELRHLRIRSGSLIAEGGAWEPLLAPFPNANSPSWSHWHENSWFLTGSIPCRNSWQISLEAGLRKIELDQHGLSQKLDDHQFKLAISYSFAP